MGIDAWGWDAPLHLQAQEAVARDEPGIFWAAHQADLALLPDRAPVQPRRAAATGFTVVVLPAEDRRRQRGPDARRRDRSLMLQLLFALLAAAVPSPLSGPWDVQRRHVRRGRRPRTRRAPLRRQRQRASPAGAASSATAAPSPGTASASRSPTDGAYVIRFESVHHRATRLDRRPPAAPSHRRVPAVRGAREPEGEQDAHAAGARRLPRPDGDEARRLASLVVQLRRHQPPGHDPPGAGRATSSSPGVRTRLTADGAAIVDV